MNKHQAGFRIALKFNICREIARMLANDFKKRVMIVDTSNEIGGDGDIPHAGIGNARRMQVPNSDMQHKVWTRTIWLDNGTFQIIFVKMDTEDRLIVV